MICVERIQGLEVAHPGQRFPHCCHELVVRGQCLKVMVANNPSYDIDGDLRGLSTSESMDSCKFGVVFDSCENRIIVNYSTMSHIPLLPI
jgi:hypothetical protein